MLLFDTTPDLAATLADWLAPDARAFDNADELFRHLQDSACSARLLIADADSYLRYRLTYPAPDCAVVWMTASPITGFLRLAIAHNVTTILPKQLPLRKHFWQMVITGVQQGHLSVDNLIIDGGKTESWLVQNSTGILEGFYRLRQFFEAANARELDDLSTVYMEAVTNAVYHAVKTPGGHDLYEKGSFIEALPPEAWVHVTVWRDAEKAGVIVRDHGGSVKIDDALYWLDRHIRGAGQLDVHGRGFFLMRMLTDGFSLTVKPGEFSELAAWQFHHPSSHPNKPLLFLKTA